MCRTLVLVVIFLVVLVVMMAVVVMIIFLTLVGWVMVYPEVGVWGMMVMVMVECGGMMV